MAKSGRVEHKGGSVDGSPLGGKLTSPPAVVVSGASVSYDRGDVLTEVSFSVEPGRTLIVMGASGAGKSTLIRTVLGLLQPNRGAVRIGGHDMHAVSTADAQALRRSFGVLLGGSSLYDGSVFGSKTAWENVRYPLEARGFSREAADARVRARMTEFGLLEHADKLPDQLSSGTRRRLGLATAFVASPSLIVLDDPGAAMDLVNRDAIIESIRAARESTSSTMILACHDIEMARALGDQMVVLLAGCVVASGPASELLDGVDDADSFDERFSFSRAFAETDAGDEGTFDRVVDNLRKETSWLPLVYTLLFLVGAGCIVALWAGVASGIIRW